jgi:hypothetical protein
MKQINKYVPPPAMKILTQKCNGVENLIFMNVIHIMNMQ